MKLLNYYRCPKTFDDTFIVYSFNRDDRVRFGLINKIH